MKENPENVPMCYCDDVPICRCANCKFFTYLKDTQTKVSFIMLAYRQTGTLAYWHIGTIAHRHIGTLAHWHIGTLANLSSNSDVNLPFVQIIANNPAE